jgi:hypothetical protein
MDDELWAKDQPDDLLDVQPARRRQHTTWRKEKTARLTKTWAKIPHDQGLQLAKQARSPLLAVLLALEAAVHEEHSNQVKLTNGLLGQYAITPQSKTRGLRQLAAAKVISIKRGGSKQAPVVTHHWYTKDGELRKRRRAET